MKPLFAPLEESRNNWSILEYERAIFSLQDLSKAIKLHGGQDQELDDELAIIEEEHRHLILKYLQKDSIT